MRLLMPTADAECQTPEVSAPDVLHKIFDQVVRSNMRMQDLRNRVKDTQDDIKEIKRQLKIEDVPGEKRMKFAIDPSQGKPGDYAKDEFDWSKKTLRLGSDWSSNMSTQREELSSDVKPKALWPPSDVESPKMTEEKEVQDSQDMKGITSSSKKEEMKGSTSKKDKKKEKKEKKKKKKEDDPSASRLSASYVPYSPEHTPDEAASDPPMPCEVEEMEVEEPVLGNLVEEDASDVSELFEAEGGNTFPQVDEPIPALETEEVVMIIFDGDSQPVRLDQLTWEQEWMLENGCYYRYYVAENSLNEEN